MRRGVIRHSNERVLLEEEALGRVATAAAFEALRAVASSAGEDEELRKAAYRVCSNGNAGLLPLGRDQARARLLVGASLVGFLLVP